MYKSISKVPETDDSGPLFVGSLKKGFRVLAAFDEEHAILGITEIAQRTGLDKSAAQRFSNTLHQLGMLEKDPVTRRYRPGRRLMEFAFIYMRHSALGAAAMPRLIEAGRHHHTTVNLAECDDLDMIYTVRIPNEKAAYPATVPGRRVPTFCTASGLAALSRMSPREAADIVARSDRIKHLPATIIDPPAIMKAIARVRRDGFAVTQGQLMHREIAVAAPIVNAQGRPVGAVSIPVYKPKWTVSDARAKLGSIAVETADAISGAILSSEPES